MNTLQVAIAPQGTEAQSVVIHLLQHHNWVSLDVPNLVWIGLRNQSALSDLTLQINCVAHLAPKSDWKHRSQCDIGKDVPMWISWQCDHCIHQRGSWRRERHPLQRGPFVVHCDLDVENVSGGRSGLAPDTSPKKSAPPSPHKITFAKNSKRPPKCRKRAARADLGISDQWDKKISVEFFEHVVKIKPKHKSKAKGRKKIVFLFLLVFLKIWPWLQK